MNKAYKRAGVDIDAGNEAVERMKRHVAKTFRTEVRTGLGGFGSLFALPNKYKQPILVSGTDGVGTKLKIAFELDKHDTVGIDLVAMCVNDILAQGAEPLFFLDYIATGKLVPEKIEEIVKGIANGCEQGGCALIGGETAEMPGMYVQDEYDLAGFAVGVVEEAEIIDGSKIKAGDVLIGLASNGLHSNGYSLVRYLLEENGYHLNDYIKELDRTLGEELLKPTRIYVRPILEMMKQVKIKGIVHVTGGGFIENIPRVLPKKIQANIEMGSWDIPPIFTFLQKIGSLKRDEMYRTFNMGIGLILIVDEKDKDLVINLAKQQGEKAYLIGSVSTGNQDVILLGDE
ncbi:phosphoribosylformylglycinamidine cyclo-ligase [Vulcanibacillus modesticaldus]|uniref:Phosphoribosylformylglycinamidine cyclo-ligase n=1 Tax=Vulcanibacillus modesticaldus TaxID=337097 RepID=A0A1D2YUT9_9BACI|nr:phosphoribosylformylglycinamidine cyclo-ligase [Vulcanibacillus modesticaldus]OEF99474.1 phosphoribosylformylglycinamidine cyclo-ligase [Vulcanibacillus modesticaldus]